MKNTNRETGMATRLAWYGLAVVIVASCQVQAQTTPADSSSPVVIGGFVDTYFSWNFNRPTSHKNELASFDLMENQFTLAAAEVEISKAAAPIGFRVELAGGLTPNMIQGGLSATEQLFQQAYVTAVIPWGAGLTVDAGKFYTHMGYELPKAKDNYNYSRSFLFTWPIPAYHTGLRATYPVRDNFTVMAHICNGWNGMTANSGKTFGVSLSYVPVPALSLIGNWLGGPEEADSVGSEFRHVVEGVISLQASENVTLAADAVYGSEKIAGISTHWSGVAGYCRYAFTGNSALTLRGEVYSDPSGFTTGLVQDLNEFTLTYEQRVGGNLIFRAEYRYDKSTASPFDGSDGDATKSSQSRLGLACVVTF
jgi:hypothetical protein